MSSTQRERAILEHLSQAGTGRIAALAERLGVTEETVRRSVRRLEAQGLVTKVHGGVHLRDWGAEPTFAQRYVRAPDAKRRIAAAVAALIPDGAGVMLDVGSTTAYVAQALRQRRDLMVVTNALPVAQALTGWNGNRVFMAGGELRSHDGGTFGAEALAFLRQFRVQHAILSVAAIDARAGFLLQDLREAEFARAMIAQADETIVAADSTKFARSAPITVAPPGSVQRLVTETAPPPPLAAALSGAGVAVTVAR